MITGREVEREPLRVCRRLQFLRGWSNGQAETTRSKFSSELRERAARMVLDHQAEYPSRWAALTAVAAKIGCTPETLRLWVAKAEGKAQRTAAETDMAAKLKALERENRELRQANEILRKASAYFAQAELDRPSKP